MTWTLFSLAKAIGGTLRVYPSAAVMVTITSPAVAFGNGAFVTIVAATAKAGNIINVLEVMAGTATQIDYEIDIATGAAGSEVVIATVKDKDTATTTTVLANVHPVNPPASYGNAVRLSARLRTSSAAAQSAVVGLETAE